MLIIFPLLCTYPGEGIAGGGIDGLLETIQQTNLINIILIFSKTMLLIDGMMLVVGSVMLPIDSIMLPTMMLLVGDMMLWLAGEFS